MMYEILSAATGAAILASGSASPPQCVVSGSYVLDGGRSDNVERAIASATAGLPNTDYFSRRLRKANIAVDGIRIRISSPPGGFSIKYETRPLILVSTSGELAQWKLNDGQIFDVSAKASGDSVLITFRAPDNERTTMYRVVGPDFVEETMITSPRLPKPLHYKLTYKEAKC
ncbi:hypothetical protein [Sphingomonas faeni]|uniref:hypothetical protein n=1 Tax=Sphingomonas faeni TaxID=185950 RepID=UPI0024139C64|nr:hypothetical protein [Sphingomonas faeni]